jgi:hypothetical protein
MKSHRLTGCRCQCPVCGSYFNSVKAFDRHRVGVYPNSRRCLTQPEMVNRGMTVNAAGFWITEIRPRNRLKTVALQIPAALRETPLDHHGGGL